MKKVKIKLNAQEARLMAENLSQMIQLMPNRDEYPRDSSGDYWYEVDRCVLGIVTLLWQKYLTRLLGCESTGTVTLVLPEPLALAYKLKLAELKNIWLSEDHEQIGLNTYQQIDQMI